MRFRWVCGMCGAPGREKTLKRRAKAFLRHFSLHVDAA